VLLELDFRKLTWNSWPLISRTIGCDVRGLGPGSTGLGRLLVSAAKTTLFQQSSLTLSVCYERCDIRHHDRWDVTLKEEVALDAAVTAVAELVENVRA
jgi:hypothetical protein